MVARIKRDFHFFAGAYLEKEYQIDFFTVTAYMDVISTNIDEQTIAFQRLKYFYTNCLDNSVFVQQDEKKAIDGFLNLGIKVSVLPTEPVDQAIAIVLLHKMSSICEGRIFTTNLVFKSHLSDNVEYLVDVDESHGNFDAKSNGYWWHDVGTNITPKKFNKKEKIVQLHKPNTDWVDLGMGWKQTAKQDNPIIFTLDTEKT